MPYRSLSEIEITPSHAKGRFKNNLGHKNVSSLFLKCFYKFETTEIPTGSGTNHQSLEEVVSIDKVLHRIDEDFKKTIDEDFYQKKKGLNTSKARSLRQEYIQKGIQYIIDKEVESGELVFTETEVAFMKKNAGLS